MEQQRYGCATRMTDFRRVFTGVAPHGAYGVTSQMWRDSAVHRASTCIENAIKRLTAATVAGRLAMRSRESLSRRKGSAKIIHRLPRLQRHAVMEAADPDNTAVQRWVSNFVIGHGFCPWAKPASAEGRIRIVSSDSSTEAGVMADLSAEAARLAKADVEPIPGQANTTLLVCAQVNEWQDFHAFNKFYVSQLANGYAMAELDLFVVAFHPKFGSLGPEPSEGETIELGDSSAPVRGTVVDLNAGFGEQGQRLARVQISGGGETYICLPPAPDPLSTMASRAPRPTLHLLRVCDLDQADDPDLQSRNRQRAKELGAQAAEAILQACG